MAKLIGDYSIKESTGYWLRETYNTVSENLQKKFDQYDVSVAQWPILYSIYDESCNTPAELAEHLNLNRSAITRLLDRLEKKGLVIRVSSTEDKRSVFVELSQSGLSIVQKLAEIARETNNRILSGLSAQEIKTFDGILKKITSNALADQ